MHTAGLGSNAQTLLTASYQLDVAQGGWVSKLVLQV